MSKAKKQTADKLKILKQLLNGLIDFHDTLKTAVIKRSGQAYIRTCAGISMLDTLNVKARETESLLSEIYGSFGRGEIISETSEGIVRGFCRFPDIKAEPDDRVLFDVVSSTISEFAIKTKPDEVVIPKPISFSPCQDVTDLLNGVENAIVALNLLKKPSDKARDEAAPPKADTVKNVSAEAKAIAILIDNPEWSDTRIAKEAGIYRTTLYDFPKFMEARRLQKEEGKKSLPGGSKDGETGTMEAWER